MALCKRYMKSYCIYLKLFILEYFNLVTLKNLLSLLLVVKFNSVICIKRPNVDFRDAGIIETESNWHSASDTISMWKLAALFFIVLQN